MSASSKRRRRTVQKRNATTWAVPAAPANDPAPPVEETTTPAPEPAQPRRNAGCPVCGVESFASTAEALQHGRSSQHQANARNDLVQSAATFGRSDHLRRTVPPSPGRGPRLQEAKPWELYNSDGSLNLASYSFSAVVSMVDRAHREVSQRVADVQGETGVAPEIHLGEVQRLAGALLHAADRAQSLTRRDGRVDRMDASHSRSRGAVFTSLRVYPVPWHVDDDVRSEWLTNLSDHAAALLRIAFDLFREHETGEL